MTSSRCIGAAAVALCVLHAGVLFVPASARLLQEKNNTGWDYEKCTMELGGPLSAVAVPSTVVGVAAPGGVSMPAGGRAGTASAPAVGGGAAMAAEAGDTLGFRPGGAQDVENFRENVKAGYLPLPTDLTFTGVANGYFFDTYSQQRQPCSDLFCPLYSLGVAPDPLLDSANSSQLYLAVGLDSGIQASQFKRKRLNLQILLDVSGSMSSPFNRYYYDSTGQQRELSEEEQAATKLDVAKEVLQGIVDQLNPEDSLGVTLFSDGACTPRSLEPLQGVDLGELKRQMDRDIVTLGGTNLQAGLDEATNALTGCKPCLEASRADVENRLILITDAQPNEGDITDQGLLARLKSLASDGVGATLIGIGLDFNTALVEEISKTRGALYFSVHSPGEFRRRLVEDFDYSVTPLVYDLQLRVDAAAPDASSEDGGNSRWRILHQYGSPNANDTAISMNGTVLRISTLFPSPKTEEGIKGGVVLLRLAPPEGGMRPLPLEVTYEDREGKSFSSKRAVEVPQDVASSTGGGTLYQSSGVRKAVLLARYTDILHDWLLDEWARVEEKGSGKEPVYVIPDRWCGVYPRLYCPLPVEAYGERRVQGGCALQTWLRPDGCVLPPPLPVLTPLLGRWERQSEPLEVGSDAKEAIQQFLSYFEEEQAALGDDTLGQEADLMQKLLAA